MKVTNCDIKNKFNEVYEEVIISFNSNIEEDNDINDISNLALLDSETNRGYKNVFPMKRMTIIQREKEGTFIPLCTKTDF